MKIENKLSAEVVGLYTASKDSGVEKFKTKQVEVTLEGVKGDKHAGFMRGADSRTPKYPRGEQIKNTRQFSAVSVEELRIIAELMGVTEVDAAWLGANICFSLLPNLTDLPLGSKIIFPDRTVLVVEGENIPCQGPGDVIAEKYPTQEFKKNDFQKAAKGKRGVVGWVEREGTITEGDLARVEVYEQQKYFYKKSE